MLALEGQTAEVSLAPFIYEHEEQASRLVATDQEQVDGLPFTSGATLLRALVEQLRLGHDAAALSIDTLTPGGGIPPGLGR